MPHQDPTRPTAPAAHHQDLQAVLDWLTADADFAAARFRGTCTWSPRGLCRAAMLWAWTGDGWLGQDAPGRVPPPPRSHALWCRCAHHSHPRLLDGNARADSMITRFSPAFDPLVPRYVSACRGAAHDGFGRTPPHAKDVWPAPGSIECRGLEGYRRKAWE
jgi:hypothetical protein